MKNSIAFLLATVLFFKTQSQINYTSRPAELQMYPRNISTNLGTVVTSGTVTAIGYSQIKLEIFRNTVLVKTSTQNLSGTIGEAFSFSETIAAELANYRFTVSLQTTPGNWTADYTADNVVAGDAIIIQGQSNAEAQMYSGSSAAYNSDFIRVYGSGSDVWFLPMIHWYIAQGDGYSGTSGNTGQWGLVLAKTIVNDLQYPVTVFNGAAAAQPISNFLRNNSLPNDLSTNYGRMLKRIEETGFKNNIRAIFWYQGEANATAPELDNISSYKTKFYQLRNAWLLDYPGLSHFYLAQIRHGCGTFTENNIFVREALRQIAVENADTRIYGTGALQQDMDGCHFPFVNGYEKLGQHMALMVKQDLYSAPVIPNTESPLVTGAIKTGTAEISLTLKNSSDNITIDAGALNDFYFEGAAVQPTILSGSVSGNKIILTLNTIPPDATGISYVEKHPGANSPNIRNASDMAMVNFYNMTLTLGAVPLKLISFSGAWKTDNSISINWSAAEISEMNGFELEYSITGSSFQKIGFIPANNRSGITSYSFQHTGVQSELNYYRVKFIERDGSFHYSPVIVLRSNTKKQMSVTVSPNPSRQTPFIFISTPRGGNAEIILFNSVGQKITAFTRTVSTGTNTIIFPGSVNMGKGLFFVYVKINNEKQQTRFFIAE